MCPSVIQRIEVAERRGESRGGVDVPTMVEELMEGISNPLVGVVVVQGASCVACR